LVFSRRFALLIVVFGQGALPVYFGVLLPSAGRCVATVCAEISGRSKAREGHSSSGCIALSVR
jgi:hypothetical protein